MIDFATAAVALYAGHHAGDYWVQTDTDARHKGDAGWLGRLSCLNHVITYLLTQVIFLMVTIAATGHGVAPWRLVIAMAVSGVTHYLADRREHGLMFWFVARVPGLSLFREIGRPRPGRDDNPCLATGTWALDQAWHIVFSVFVPALIIGT